MIQKLKSMILVTVSALTFGAPILVPAVVHAACAAPGTSIKDSIGSGVDGATGANGVNSTCESVAGDGAGSIQNTAKTVVNIFSILVGVVAVIFVIYGGFRYITSGGDSGKVGSAKNTLIYALVGLVIVALAQLIVRYVLTSATTAVTG